MQGKWRCLIVEDDAETARYIADGLGQHGHAVSLCRDGVQGLAQSMEQDWDLIILDRMLPNQVDGLSILSTLRGLGKETPVLVLSALNALDERVRGLKAGGDDYLTKPFAFAELYARLEALARRSRRGDQPVLHILDLTADLGSGRVTRAGQVIALQPREFRLLAYLMQHEGQVVTRTMLLEAVWDYRFDPQTNLIDVQISRLRRKLDVAACAPLIHTVRGVGYTMSATPPSADGAG